MPTSIDSEREILQLLLKQRRFRELSERVSRLVQERHPIAADDRIGLARLLALGANWESICELLPPETCFLESSGWLASLAHARPIDRSGTAIPWFTYPAIDFLVQIVRPEWNVFEWGAGYSTFWWAQRVHSVTSVEDDRGWFDALQPQVAGNVDLLWRAEAASYVAAIGERERRYDLVVVDGSHRNQCAERALESVTEAGLILLDNSDMAAHRAGGEYLEGKGWHRIDFYGLIPAYHYKNCTSVYFRDPASLRPKTWPGGLESCVGPTCDQAVRRAAAEGRVPAWVARVAPSPP